MATPFEKFYKANWASADVISKEQLAAYGNYDAATKALKFSNLWLEVQIEDESRRHFSETGHC